MYKNNEEFQRKQEMLQGWCRGLRILSLGNFRAATYYNKRHKTFGTLVVIATSVVGSTIFGTLGKNSNPPIQVAAGCISLFAVVLSSLQTFLGYSELSNKHKDSGIKFGELRSEVQVLLSDDFAKIPDLEAKINSIQAKWNVVEKECPSVPKKIYDLSVETVDSNPDPECKFT